MDHPPDASWLKYDEDIFVFGCLSDQLRYLQATLGRLAEEAATAEPFENKSSTADKQARVSNVLRFRQKRRTVFDDTFFGEPAWDMLLQLYATSLRGKGEESVSSLCIASGVPSTTALRWISHLEDGGWVEKSPDPADRRRTFVSLTRKSAVALDAFFDA